MTTLPAVEKLHRCSILEGTITCEKPGCTFRLDGVDRYRSDFPRRLASAHLANPRATGHEVLEFVALGLLGAA